MTTHHRLRALALTAFLTAPPGLPARALPNLGIDLAGASVAQSSLLELTDARSYRHCHNRPRRQFTCHTKEPLR
jgi:hypothetical protein